MGTGSPVDFTSADAEGWWREQAKRVLELGVAGIKADDGEGCYIPDDVRFADGPSGAQSAWGHGLQYRRSMQRALDEVHPGPACCSGARAGQASRPSAIKPAHPAISQPTSGRSEPSSPRRSPRRRRASPTGRTTSAATSASARRPLLEGTAARWVQFGCFTPLMQAHGRFEQEAWTYDEETLALYRTYVLLHERLVPYVRAAAATAARSGLPIIRPLALTDPHDARGWSIADAYGYGPSLWVAPVLEDGPARSTSTSRAATGSTRTGEERPRAAGSRRARAAGSDPGLGPSRRDHPQLPVDPYRPWPRRRARVPSARSRPRCTGSPPADGRWPVWPTERSSGTLRCVVHHFFFFFFFFFFLPDPTP